LALAGLAACGGGDNGGAPAASDSGSANPMDGAGPRGDATTDAPPGNGDDAGVDGGAGDGPPSGDAPTGGDSAGDAGNAGDGGLATAVLSGTLVFSGVTSVDGSDPPHQLFAIDLGAAQRTIAPLSVVPNRGAWMPYFAHDGSQLFFTQVDQDPASPTNGQLLLVTAHPDASNPTLIASCGASAPGGWRGPFCGFPSPGADGNIWYLLANKPPVADWGQQVLHVPPAGGAMPSVWLDFPSDPTCTIYSMAMSPDRTRVAFVIGDTSACGAVPAGLYVVPITATSIGTPITPYSVIDSAYTVPFTTFNRAGDRVYYIGSDSKLYSEKLDGTDAQLACDADLSLQGDTGAAMAVVNDAYVVMGGAPGGIGAVPFVGAPGNGKFFVVAPAYGVDALTWTP
jgi:hypothetical protein